MEFGLYEIQGSNVRHDSVMASICGSILRADMLWHETRSYGGHERIVSLEPNRVSTNSRGVHVLILEVNGSRPMGICYLA